MHRSSTLRTVPLAVAMALRRVSPRQPAAAQPASTEQAALRKVEVPSRPPRRAAVAPVAVFALSPSMPPKLEDQLVKEVALRKRKRDEENKKRRAKIRQADCQADPAAPPLRASKGLRSILEGKKPGPLVQADYTRRLTSFSEFCRKHVLPKAEAKQLDIALCDYSDKLYLEGEQHDHGSKLLAALIWDNPELGAWGTWRIPRFHRVLRSWARFAPTGVRDPIAYLVACGIIGAAGGCLPQPE